MHENSPVLPAQKRERIGSRYAQRDRAAGKLPAVLYGHGEEPVAIAVEAREAIRHIHKGEKVFRLNFDGGNADGAQVVLLKDLQFDYLGTNIVHADFVRVDLNERIHTRVHVALVGDAVGLKTAGAILMHPVTEIDVECRVTDIPESIEVNIASLEVGGHISAGDVKLPVADMKLVSDPHAILATILLQKEAPTAEASAVTAAAAPEVLTAKKPEGDAAGKDAKKK